MASNAGKPNDPFYTLSAKERAKIPIPDRFKCRQCNQFKIPAHFSNKEIKNYQSKKTLIPITNGVTAGIRCRSCAGEQVHELQCEGPCGFKKPLDCFSKSQRRGGLKWCQECVLWKEATEPGTVPTAPPGSEPAPDEIYSGAGWDYSSDPEIGSESDDESDYPFLPWQGIASMNISDKERANVASAVGVRRSKTAAFSTTSSMPRPQDRGSAVASDCIPSRTVTASQSGYVPPHIRAKNGDSSAAITQSKPAAENLIDIDGDVKTVSSASNSYEDAWSSTGTLGPWSAVDTRRRNAFYAPQRPVEERTPSLHVATSASSQLIGRNGWAKPARGPPPRYEPPVPTPTRHRYIAYESDGSPDEM
ncbi:hypothetical protein OIDMADRAFT_49094 [Oidiodendron maius Zn]|uniref:Stc1 domain-containing protein n=1 Tax=Oidiodendron maius (strain Zn) TaxID=913774 RepID=A0A0C3HBG5_OIDMZ|nr:hypothetical protein OIDMADRAFT_49094 [Oidiodendron maius Zn]